MSEQSLMEQKAKELTNKVENLSTQINSLKKQRANHEDDCTRLTNKKADLQKETDGMQQSLKTVVRVAVKKAQAHLDDLIEEQNGLIATLKREREVVAKAKEAHDRAIHSANAKEKSLEGERTQLKNAIADANSVRDKLKGALGVLKGVLDE